MRSVPIAKLGLALLLAGLVVGALSPQSPSAFMAPHFNTPISISKIEALQLERFVVRVPEEFPTIQAAIDAVDEGGTVLIGPGVYKENVQIRKSLRLVGAGQEQVQIQATDESKPIIHVQSKTPSQVYLQGLTLGDPTIPLEQVLQRPFPTPITSSFLPWTGLFVAGPMIQTLVRQVTVGGLGGGIWIGDFSFEEFVHYLFQPSVILEEVRLTHNAIGLGVGNAQGFILRSVIEENFDGIWSFEGSLSLHYSVVRRNQQTGVNLSVRDGPYLIGHISDNKITQNGIGVYLAAWREGSWVEISSNRFIQNEQYAVIVQDLTCPYVLNFVPKEIPSRPIQILGSANEFRENTKADLCPPDYPWPPGFRK